jgi:hypothetical protein
MPQLPRILTMTATATILTGLLVCSPLVPSFASAPTATPVHVKYFVRGATVGSGTALNYDGGVYVPLGAVQKLTGTSVSWDAKTSTVSAGAAPLPSSRSYLEDLPGQPYYVSSGALCWQYSTDGRASPIHSSIDSGYCNTVLPAAPSVLGAHYAHELAVLVSATGSKAVTATNTVVMNFDLAGKYQQLAGIVGLADNPFNRVPMEIGFRDNGITIFTTELLPGSAPLSFKIDVSHVQQLNLFVANISGGAPNWKHAQYDPGAVALANAQLASS